MASKLVVPSICIFICISMLLSCTAVKIGMHNSELQHDMQKRSQDFPDYPSDVPADVPSDSDPAGEPVAAAEDPTGPVNPEPSDPVASAGSGVIPRKGKAKRRLHKKLPDFSDSQGLPDESESGTGQTQLSQGYPAVDPVAEDPTGSVNPDTSDTIVSVVQPRQGKAKRRLHKKLPNFSVSQGQGSTDSTGSTDESRSGTGQSQLFGCSKHGQGSSNPGLPDTPGQGEGDAPNHIAPAESPSDARLEMESR